MSDPRWKMDLKDRARLQELERDGYLMIGWQNPTCAHVHLTNKGLSVLMAHAEPPIPRETEHKSPFLAGLAWLKGRKLW
jgi:hypothetical protein